MEFLSSRAVWGSSMSSHNRVCVECERIFSVEEMEMVSLNREGQARSTLSFYDWSKASVKSKRNMTGKACAGQELLLLK